MKMAMSIVSLGLVALLASAPFAWAQGAPPSALSGVKEGDRMSVEIAVKPTQ